MNKQQIAANTLRAYGISVVFQNPEENPKQQKYTYLSTALIQPGAMVVVYTRKELKVAWAVGFDNPAKLEPEAKFLYKWIVDVVDFTHYRKCLADQQEILDSLELPTAD